jgi:hypothetical protein
MSYRTTQVQSILIPKDKYTLIQAKAWVKKQGYIVDYPGKPKGPDITEHFYRFRQLPPSKLYNYRTVSLRKEGILLVVKV